ncbi:MAG: hypothetical protein R3240_12135, partial [Gammaproteobacteria bacterium]|nr:hypothetical protein [Gammaproteobacteria bacterium]
MYQASSLGNRLNPFTLTFCDSKFEREFRASHRRKTLLQVRRALIIAAVLYLFYGILDFMVLAAGQWQAVLIRFAVVAPIFALGFFATYKRFFRRRLQTLVMLMVFTGGIGLSFIGLSSEALHSDLYFLGPVFPIFWAFI